MQGRFCRVESPGFDFLGLSQCSRGNILERIHTVGQAYAYFTSKADNNSSSVVVSVRAIK